MILSAFWVWLISDFADFARGLLLSGTWGLPYICWVFRGLLSGLRWLWFIASGYGAWDCGFSWGIAMREFLGFEFFV